ncbi:putative oxidoreductase MhqP [bacterium BMS3Bbin06]|nr:putative oxidoreductase MhqP [bacterium BMS3Abin08]GBE34070.1 putative oxidoreductase MhqP [bacterium BMS3Bbin06]
MPTCNWIVIAIKYLKAVVKNKRKEVRRLVIRKLIQTDEDVSSIVLRMGLGAVFFAHGAQKLFGWFGGYGFSGTMGFLTGSLGIPALFAFLVIMAEFFGALGLLSGLLTRVSAFGIAIVMVVAILMIHLRYGFFMNWSGKQQGEGIEYHILVLTISTVLMINGGGRWSLDRLITEKIQ